MTEIIPGFDKAQAEYDRQEPPWQDECFFCEGGGIVEVARVYDLDGKPCEMPEWCTREVSCPWCVGGVERR